MNVLVSLLLASAAQVAAFPLSPLSGTSSEPRVTIHNGTIHGVRNDFYDQDFFLGIPYAQPPVGNLRFRPPQPLASSLGNFNAKQYGPHCYTAGSPSGRYPLSEDCLTLNIIRPAGLRHHSKVPVAIWFHPGCFNGGGSSDPRYNMSYFVGQSVSMNNPVIVVSLNHRLGVLGFLGGQEIASTGNANLGLKDQRMALHWVKENIIKFGGDPAKITIFGQSDGGSSVGMHMIAYNGRNDRIFHGAIMQSGAPIMEIVSKFPTTHQPHYNAIVSGAGCSNSTDTLQCLREIDVQVLDNVLPGIKLETKTLWGPMIDGEMFKDYSSKLLKDGKYVRVPVIVGTASDEGTAFAPFGDTAVNDFEGIAEHMERTSNLPRSKILELLAIYDGSDPMSIPPKQNYTGIVEPDYLGSQFHRTAGLMGDWQMHAPKRYTAEILTNHGIPVWTYRWKCVPYAYPAYVGATHSTEVPFVFYSLNQDFGTGFTNVNPMNGPNRPLYIELANRISRNWINFIVRGDPNAIASGSGNIFWPQYGDSAREMVFDIGPGGTFAGRDDYRKSGMRWINDNALLIGR